MASQSRKSGSGGFREVFSAATSGDDLLRQFIQAPLEASRASAMADGVALANFLSKLPDAFDASRRRELERIRATSDDDDPRVLDLWASLEHVEVLRTMARYGEARAQRALATFGSKDAVFHGFVSDASLAPLRGLTVRLIGGRGILGKVSSATTEADGYFCIPLGVRKVEKPDATSAASAGKSGPAADAIPPAATDVEVEVFRKGTVLHHDPVPVTLDGSRVYREYVISDGEPESASGFREFMSARSYEAPAAAASAPRSKKRVQKRDR